MKFFNFFDVPLTLKVGFSISWPANLPNQILYGLKRDLKLVCLGNKYIPTNTHLQHLLYIIRQRVFYDFVKTR